MVLGLAPRIRYFALFFMLLGGPILVHDTLISEIDFLLQRMFLLSLYVQWSVAVGRGKYLEVGCKKRLRSTLLHDKGLPFPFTPCRWVMFTPL